MKRAESVKALTPPAKPSVDVREGLREDILSCRLMPGTRLKFGDLQTRYGASIATLREALTELAADGLVHAETNRGFTVAPVSIADLLDITELRVDLEIKALTSSIQRGGDDWETAVLGAFHLLQKMENDVRRARDAEMTVWADRHRRFHDALVSACASPWVLRFRKTLYNQARRYRALSMKHSATPGRIDQHRQLMEATLSRNVEAACSLAEAHIRDTAKNILESMPGFQALASDESHAPSSSRD